MNEEGLHLYIQNVHKSYTQAYIAVLGGYSYVYLRPGKYVNLNIYLILNWYPIATAINS